MLYYEVYLYGPRPVPEEGRPFLVSQMRITRVRGERRCNCGVIGALGICRIRRARSGDTRITGISVWTLIAIIWCMSSPITIIANRCAVLRTTISVIKGTGIGSVAHGFRNFLLYYLANIIPFSVLRVGGVWRAQLIVGRKCNVRSNRGLFEGWRENFLNFCNQIRLDNRSVIAATVGSVDVTASLSRAMCTAVSKSGGDCKTTWFFKSERKPWTK